MGREAFDTIIVTRKGNEWDAPAANANNECLHSTSKYSQHQFIQVVENGVEQGKIAKRRNG